MKSEHLLHFVQVRCGHGSKMGDLPIMLNKNE